MVSFSISISVGMETNLPKTFCSLPLPSIMLTIESDQELPTSLENHNRVAKCEKLLSLIWAGNSHGWSDLVTGNDSQRIL